MSCRYLYRFILLPSSAALICSSCGAFSKGPVSSAPVTSTVVAPAEDVSLPASPPAAPTAPSASAYAEAINLASSAYLLGQTAVSPDDWRLVAGRWQRAIEKLKMVAPNDPQYSTAQSKLANYGRQIAHAQQRIEQLNRPPAAPAVQPRPYPVSASAAKSAPVPSAQIQKIPIVRRQHGTPVIQVVFDDWQTYEMILDTGASRTLITRAMANQLGVVTTGQMRATTASHEEVIFETGQVKSIAAGGVSVANLQVSIGDATDVGLLGNDFMSGYDITIRDRENVVELTRAY